MDSLERNTFLVSLKAVNNGGHRATNRNSINWQSVWLQKTVLFAFMVLFLCLILSLILINHFVARNRGLPFLLTDNHYSWTYGPTVVLVVVIGLWRRVTYCSMVNQPWQELSSGPQAADKTVLLDYLSPMQVSSLAMAIKNQHFAVAAAILIFVLLKLVVVISTALFLPGDSLFSQQIQVRLGTRFDSAEFWNMVHPRLKLHDPWRPGEYEDRYLMHDSDRLNGLTYENISAGPVWAYANFRKEYRESAPPIEKSTAFTNFSALSELPPRGVRASVNVDVFEPNATCEIAEVDLSQNAAGGTVNLTLTVHASSCHSQPFQVPVCIEEIPGRRSDPNDDGIEITRLYSRTYEPGVEPPVLCPPTARYFMVERVNCTGDSFPNTSLDESTPDIYKYALIILESKLSPRLYTEYPERGFGDWAYEVQVQQAVALICSLTYSIHRGTAIGRVLSPGHIDSLDIGSERMKGDISKLSQTQFSEVVISSLQTGGPVFNYNTSVVRETTGARALLGLMTNSSFVTRSIDPPFDPVIIKRTAEESLVGVSHQVARHYFLPPDDDGVTAGSLEYIETKLHIRPVALWTMTGLFILIAILVIVVIIYTDQSMTPSAPNVLLTVADALCRTPSMLQLLHGTGAMQSGQISGLLERHTFISIPDEDGSVRVEAIEVLSGDKSPEKDGCLTPGLETESNGRSWAPYPARKHATLLFLSLPVICIAVLELLWHFSKTNNNFVIVASDSVSYAIRYSSTAIMLLVAAAFNTLDFSIATFAPFSTLAGSDSGAPSESTLLFSVVGDLPPVALYKAIHYRHIGASLSLTASTIGSILTVVMSSLWFVDTIEISRAATAKIQSSWRVDFNAQNYTAYGSNNDNLRLFNEIQHGGTDIGSLVWNTLALPTIGNADLTDYPSSSQLGASKNISETAFNFQVPAMKAELRCSALPSSYITMENKLLDIHYDRVNATVRLPPGCKSSGATRVDTATFSRDIIAFMDGITEESNWFGYFSDLPVAPTSGYHTIQGCPSVLAVFGTYGKMGQNKTLDYRVSSVMCSQHFRSVNVDIAYSRTSPSTLAPNLTSTAYLDLKASPDILVDLQSNNTSISYTVADHFQNSTTPFLPHPGQHFDNFFNHLTAGLGDILIEDLLDSETLISNVNCLYQKFMARVIDADYRMPLNENAKNTTHQLPVQNNGIVRGTSKQVVLRLKIDGTSKSSFSPCWGR